MREVLEKYECVSFWIEIALTETDLLNHRTPETRAAGLVLLTQIWETWPEKIETESS